MYALKYQVPKTWETFIATGGLIHRCYSASTIARENPQSSDIQKVANGSKQKNNKDRLLNIVFFGSDEFSIQSFTKLMQLKNRSGSSQYITNIDLVARHPKPAGRGMTMMSDVPIVKVAEQHGARVLRAETKREINALVENEKKYDLAVAVSYGKLIPSEFILSLRYGGLNVHPSLLPRYSGASPLQFAMLNNDASTGVTVQTLHPTKFDRGRILLQSDEVPIGEAETLGGLRDKLAVIGSDLLVKVIADGLYKTGEGKNDVKSKYEYSYAGKITPDMKKIDWEKYSAQQLARRLNVLGSLYSYKEINIKKKKKQQQGLRRVIFYDVTVEDEANIGDTAGLEHNGLFKLSSDGSRVVIRVMDGYISCARLKFECFGEESAADFMKRLPKRAGDMDLVFKSLS